MSHNPTDDEAAELHRRAAEALAAGRPLADLPKPPPPRNGFWCPRCDVPLPVEWTRSRGGRSIRRRRTCPGCKFSVLTEERFRGAY